MALSFCAFLNFFVIYVASKAQRGICQEILSFCGQRCGGHARTRSAEPGG
jgi:hypothetical protein